MESFKEFYEKYPNLAFIKTKKKVEKQEDLDDWNFIIEEDTPPLEKGFSVIVPLYEKNYPKIFNMATAMEAGLYAIDICEKNDWEITIAMLLEVFKKLEENLV